MSNATQPVAWANADDDGIYEVGLSEAHAQYVCDRAAHGNYSHRNPRIVPLYRQPQPTLTAEERTFLRMARDTYAMQGDDEVCGMIAASISGLLERTK